MHVHTMVHLNYGLISNGCVFHRDEVDKTNRSHCSTLASHTGSLIHIGQLFANESWNDAVYNTSPYTTDTNERTYNADDSIYATANTAGYNAEMDIVMLGSDISDGLLGYISTSRNCSILGPQLTQFLLQQSELTRLLRTLLQTLTTSTRRVLEAPKN